MNEAASMPEGTPLCCATLSHLGGRASVTRALSRLARDGRLDRIWRGIYLLPVVTRFGRSLPRFEKVIRLLAELWGETIVPCGASAANVLRLTKQNPVIPIYFTSGPSRRLRFGALTVVLRHAPRWQLAAAHSKAGSVIRALAFLGPAEVEDALRATLPTLSSKEIDELSAARSVIPKWMSEPVRALVDHV